MIEKTKEEQLQELDKEFLKVAVYESPGVIMLALGLYGRFEAKGEAFHPLLNDSSVINGLLIVGTMIMMLGVRGIVNIARKKKKLLERTDI